MQQSPENATSNGFDLPLHENADPVLPRSAAIGFFSSQLEGLALDVTPGGAVLAELCWTPCAGAPSVRAGIDPSQACQRAAGADRPFVDTRAVQRAHGACLGTTPVAGSGQAMQAQAGLVAGNDMPSGEVTFRSNAILDVRSVVTWRSHSYNAGDNTKDNTQYYRFGIPNHRHE